MLNYGRHLVILASATIITACSEPADRTEITETAVRSEYRAEDKAGATSQERFTLPGMTTEVEHAHATDTSSKPFHYDVPAGWTELAPTQFRDINFSVGSDGDMECYVTILPGDGGGVTINANRWRGQFNATPYTEEEVKNLPDVTIMGHPAKVLNFVGEFKGMGQADAKPDWRLIGALIQSPDALITIKMTGPDTKLMPQLNSFAGFVDSLHSSDGHDHSEPDTHNHSADDGHDHGDQTASAPKAPPLAEGATMPEGHPPVTPSTPTTSPAPPEAGGFKWEVPEGWSKSSTGSSMRLITFAVGDGPAEQAECYIVVLGGNGGGRLSNYNRWLGQFDQDPLDETELMLQPTTFFFGEEVPMLVCEGSFTGMGGGAKDNQMLLGASAEINGQAVFVKMIGPKETVRSNWNKFLVYCATIEVKS